MGWAQASLPFEPAHDTGQSITGAFEGWFPNPDGTFSLLLGYYNRNQKQVLDIPAGPNNRIEPGGPDRGQPTHFLPGRQWGVFTITVPKDFGEKKLTWTLVANGKTTVIPVSLHPLYEVQPFKEASGNTPPFIAFSEGGPFVQGPRGQSKELTTTVSQSSDARAVAGRRCQVDLQRRVLWAAGHSSLEQVSRTGNGHFLERAAAGRKGVVQASPYRRVQRHGDHDGQIQRAWRIHSARSRQRLVRRRRPRLSMLLVERSSESHRKVIDGSRGALI